MPFEVQFETNGTIAPELPLQKYLLNMSFVVSPKGAFAGNEDLKSFVAEDFFSVERIELRTTFKVVHEQNNATCDDMILGLAERVGKHKVMVMPEGWLFDHKAYLYTAEFCKSHGLTMTSRLHTLLWGHTRAT
jgi:hypothetical protein